ncbi:MAG: hypothetical protein ACO2ZP_11715 [Bacteriovoracaceae bacterium]
MKHIFLFIFILFYQSCGTSAGDGGTTTGNPQTSVQIKTDVYNASPIVSRIFRLLIPTAFADITSINFCFKRIRFKLQDQDTSDPTNDEDNIDFEIGDINISSGGNTLGTINVPTGTYERIEFDLEDKCGSSRSVEVQKLSGTFSTTDRITIKFRGTINVSDGVVVLDVQNIVNALNNTTSSIDIKDNLEAVFGSY